MVVLDSCLIIDILRGKEEARKVIEDLERQGLSKTVASTTIQEIVKGACLSSKPGAELDKIEDILCALIVIPFDQEAARRAGLIEAELERKGTPIDLQDVQIAATALVQDERLITRNIKHFALIRGLKVQSY